MRITTLLALLLININLLHAQDTTTVNFNDQKIVKVNGEWSLYDSSSDKYYHLNDELLSIKFKQTTSNRQVTSFEIDNGLNLRNKNHLGWYDYNVNIPSDSIFMFAEDLQNSSLVELIEFTSFGEYLQVPNDPEFSNQWYASVIELIDTWSIENGSSGEVIVAVIDNGLNWDHEDIGYGSDNYENIFKNNSEAWSNEYDPTSGNGIDSDGNGFIDDYKGWDFYNNSNDVRGEDHGTFVAGIIAGKSNNEIGVSGVAGGWYNSGAQILGCAIHHPVYGPQSSLLDDAIVYSVDKGAKIINISFAVGLSFATQDALEYAQEKGVLVVASSGNSGGNVVSPANHPLTFSVGATNQTDNKWVHSSYSKRLDIAAPGKDIYSTFGANNYTQSSGTSFSAPIISGIAALLLAKNPCLGPRQLREIMTATAEKVGGYDYTGVIDKSGKSLELGYGRVNALKSIEEAVLFETPKKDLYMRDRYNDAGRDAGYDWTWDFDASPDIWVRNTNDGFVFENQVNDEIEFSSSQERYVYVRVGNKGCSSSDGNEKLVVYHSAAGTSTIWPDGWDGSQIGGGIIGSANIPLLDPGESIILEIPWNMMYNENTCVLARIENTGSDDPITPYQNLLGQEIYYNNNIALNNIVVVNIYPGKTPLIVDGVEYPYGSFIEVGNQSTNQEDFDLVFRTGLNEKGNLLTNEAEVVAYFDNTTWDLLSNDFENYDNVKVVNSDQRKVQFLDTLVEFKDIDFPTGQRQQIYVGFSFLTEELTDKNDFRYHVLQKKSEDDSILGDNWTGGVHFRISKYDREAFYASAGNEETVKKGESVTLSANQINESATYNWYDEEGNLIHSGISFIDNPESSKKYKLEVISSVDLFKDYDEIQIDVESCFIKNISPNPADNQINIEYLSENVSNAIVAVTPVDGNGSINNYVLNVNETTREIDISSLTSGSYSVALICDGELKDAKPIIIY